MPKTKVRIFPPSLESSLRRRDYHWIEISPEEFAKMLCEKLKSCKAKTWLLDVYCSNDAIYRNLVVKWAGDGSIKQIDCRFNRDEGCTIDISKENEG